jgi:hypothetical protein
MTARTRSSRGTAAGVPAGRPGPLPTRSRRPAATRASRWPCSTRSTAGSFRACTRAPARGSTRRPSRAASDANLSEEETAATGRRPPDTLAVTAGRWFAHGPSTTARTPPDRRADHPDPRPTPASPRAGTPDSWPRGGISCRSADPALTSPGAGLAAPLAAPTPTSDGPSRTRGTVVVVAGAGTGKTEVITRRTGWSRLLCRPGLRGPRLTFTDKAAEEMASGRPARAVRVHGYRDLDVPRLRRLPIREYARTGLPTDVRVLSRPEVIFPRGTFRVRLDSIGHWRPHALPVRAGTLFSRCKDEDIARPPTSSSPRPCAEARPRPPPRRSVLTMPRPWTRPRRQSELARTYDVPWGCSPRAGTSTSATRSRSRPACSGRRRRAGRRAGRFHIVVDEFDTDRAQAELVGLLAEGYRNVAVVGDDDQAIYAFRVRRSQHPGLATASHGTDRGPAPELSIAGPDPRRRPPPRPDSTTGPPRGPRRRQQRLKAERRRDARPVRLEAFATASDEVDWTRPRSGGGGVWGPPATTPSSSARTATQTRLWPPTSPGSRGAFRHVRALRPSRGPPLLAFPWTIADPTSSVDLMRCRLRGPVPTSTGRTDRHRHPPAGGTARSARSSRSCSPSRDPARPPARVDCRPAGRGPALVHRAVALIARRASCCTRSPRERRATA